MEILGRYTPRVEQVSIDEAFLDVAESEALFGPPPAIAAAIRAAIRTEVGLTASVGVATTKLVEDRVGPAQAGRAGRRPGRRGGCVPGAAADRAAVGRRRADAGRARRIRPADDRRPCLDRPALLVRRLGQHGATLVERPGVWIHRR